MKRKDLLIGMAVCMVLVLVLCMCACGSTIQAKDKDKDKDLGTVVGLSELEQLRLQGINKDMVVLQMQYNIVQSQLKEIESKYNGLAAKLRDESAKVLKARELSIDKYDVIFDSQTGEYTIKEKGVKEQLKEPGKEPGKEPVQPTQK
jgi:hypothetical protein